MMHTVGLAFGSYSLLTHSTLLAAESALELPSGPEMKENPRFVWAERTAAAAKALLYIYIYIYIYNTSAHRKTIMLPVVVLAARKVAAVATITTHTTSTFLANSEEEEKRFRVFQSFVEPPL